MRVKTVFLLFFCYYSRPKNHFFYFPTCGYFFWYSVIPSIIFCIFFSIPCLIRVISAYKKNKFNMLPTFSVDNSVHIVTS